MNIKDNWWKYLGVLCFVYAISAGLLVPLKPGIAEISEHSLFSGSSVDLSIKGYNTSFKHGDYSAFIRLDESNHIEATRFDVLDNQNATLHFEIPQYKNEDTNVAEATLVINSPLYGYAIYPNLRIVKPENEMSSDAEWSNILEVTEPGWRFAFPYRNIIVETIRNTFFHVAIWMAMFVLLTIALIYSILYLRKGLSIHDHVASSFTYISLVFGVIGVATGSVWARFSWGAFWTNDVKLNMVAISMMIYLAYGILRASIDDNDKRARSAAIYNIFAYAAMIPLIMIIPRMTASLHPGNGGNPAFGTDDMDNTLRLVFYPAIIGLGLIGGWIAQIIIRIKKIEEKVINRALNA